MKELKLGNNESLLKGVIKQRDGTFLGLRFTQSKSFKTKKGAEKYVFGK